MSEATFKNFRAVFDYITEKNGKMLLKMQEVLERRIINAIMIEQAFIRMLKRIV